MQRLTKILIASASVALLGVSTVLQAATTQKTKFPRGCRATGSGYEYGYLVMRPMYEKQKRTLYLVRNLTRYNIQLKSIKDPKDIFTPAYNKLLPRNKWAAFALDRDHMSFQCIHVKSKTSQEPVRCDGLFAVCEYDNVKFPHASMGTYWIDKTGTMRQTMRASIREGILLRW